MIDMNDVGSRYGSLTEDIAVDILTEFTFSMNSSLACLIWQTAASLLFTLIIMKNSKKNINGLTWFLYLRCYNWYISSLLADVNYNSLCVLSTSGSRVRTHDFEARAPRRRHAQANSAAAGIPARIDARTPRS